MPFVAIFLRRRPPDRDVTSLPPSPSHTPGSIGTVVTWVPTPEELPRARYRDIVFSAVFCSPPPAWTDILLDHLGDANKEIVFLGINILSYQRESPPPAAM